MTGSSQVQDGPERRYTLEDLTLSPAERKRVELRGLLMAAIYDGLDGAVTGALSDRGVERCADHVLREWVPRFLASRGVADPTAQPDPRRWGTERRTGKRQRVYWDASLYARGENAWTNVERTERFTADSVIADKEVPRG